MEKDKGKLIKDWRCTNGHKWSGGKGYGGYVLSFEDPRSETSPNTDIKIGPYCVICMAQNIDKLFVSVGKVEEDCDEKK